MPPSATAGETTGGTGAPPAVNGGDAPAVLRAPVVGAWRVVRTPVVDAWTGVRYWGWGRMARSEIGWREYRWFFIKVVSCFSRGASLRCYCRVRVVQVFP